MKTSLDLIIEKEMWAPETDEQGEIDFEMEYLNSPYPGISCVTPSARANDPYVLHCFPAFKTDITNEQRRHLDIIAEKIQRSFSTSRPITKVLIVGHSSTWHKTPRSKLEQRAFQRAGNAGSELVLRLLPMGLAKRVEVETDGLSDRVSWKGKPYSSTSGSREAQNDRALNRRVEIFLIRPPKPPKPKPLKKELIQGITWVLLGEAPSDYAWRKVLQEAKVVASLLKAAFTSINNTTGPIGPGFFLTVYTKFDVEYQEKPYVVRGIAMGMAYAIMDAATGKTRTDSALKQPREIPTRFRKGFNSGYKKMRARIKRIRRRKFAAVREMFQRLAAAEDKRAAMILIYGALMRVFRLKENLHKHPVENSMFRFCRFTYPMIKACCGDHPGCRLDL